MNKKNNAIYLASASPRRQELLRQVGVIFDVIPAEVTEAPHLDEPPQEYVRRLAREKATVVANIVKDKAMAVLPVLGADTEVVLEGEVLGKPRDRLHGISMLQRLSGKTHDVLTAVALVHDNQLYEALSESRVTFARLTAGDIARYWASGEPNGKAGGYAIQGRAAAFITHIEGSYSGIVGLPLHDIVRLLKRIGWKV
jgi:septum formation protein